MIYLKQQKLFQPTDTAYNRIGTLGLSEFYKHALHNNS